VTDEMKIAAAHAIASIVGRGELHPEYVIPSVFNKRVAPAVAREVMRAAQRAGVARRRKSSPS
jgi:malate dehydrogenase (oxaloacetate-decarboxylating)